MLYLKSYIKLLTDGFLHFTESSCFLAHYYYPDFGTYSYSEVKLNFMKTMTSNQNYLTLYKSKIDFLEKKQNLDLTVFLVDDNKVYLKLLEQELSKNPKYKIYSFLSGEACLEKLYLKPDIAIVDYHLDERSSDSPKKV